MFDTATLMQINDLRGRVLRNEFVPPEELNAALKLVAQGRAIAAATSVKKKEAKASLVVPTGDSLLAKMAEAVTKKER